MNPNRTSPVPTICRDCHRGLIDDARELGIDLPYRVLHYPWGTRDDCVFCNPPAWYPDHGG